MQFDFPHTLGSTEASERIHVLCTYLLNRHNIAVNWSGFQGTFDGKYLMIKIQGEMQITEDTIHFDGKDPGILWRKKAIRYLKEKLELYLDPAIPIHELPTQKV